VADQVSKELGVSFIILNKPGAGGTVGLEFLRHSKPDGYTLAASFIGVVTIPILDPKCPFALDDFDPICLYDTQANSAAVRNESPFKTIKELIDFAKSNPGKLSYGSQGIGATGHFFGETFKQSLGLELTHVPFKGDAPLVAALVGGHVDLGFPTLTGSFSLMKGGKLRGLGLGSKERSSDFPEMLTFAEMGYPDVGVETWHGMLGPKGIPKPVMEKLSAAFDKALRNPSVQARLKQIGLVPANMNGKEYREFMKKETERLTKVAKKAGMMVKY
jgi:tripartite-type tricarboxylate transporter receptor subunit TctC